MKSPRKSLRRLPLAAIVVALLVAACGGATTTQAPTAGASEPVAAEPVDLRVAVWTGNEAHLALFNEIAAAYQATDPRVKSITFETLPFEQYTTVLTTQLAGGNPPDLGWIFETNAPEFVAAGVLTDLGPTLRADADYKFSDVLESALSLWVKGDAVYAYPFSTSPFAVFYNADMFAAAGLDDPDKLVASGRWSWEELARAAGTMAAKDPGKFGLVVRDFDYKGWDFLASVWRGFGADPWSADGKTCTFAEQPMVDAMSFFHRMVFQDKAHPAPGQSADFFAGEAAMTITQISKAGLLKEVAWGWGVVPLPKGPAGDAQVIGQAGWGVFSAGKNPDVSADFLAVLTNEENAKRLSQFFPPPRKALLSAEILGAGSPLLNEAQLQAVVIDGIAEGVVKPSHPNFARIRDAVRAQLDALWRPDADVGVVLSDVCGAITPLLGS